MVNFNYSIEVFIVDVGYWIRFYDIIYKIENFNKVYFLFVV